MCVFKTQLQHQRQIHRGGLSVSRAAIPGHLITHEFVADFLLASTTLDIIVSRVCNAGVQATAQPSSCYDQNTG